jgi:fructoselysine-6-P-deglycase FrlB-like protein
VAASQSAGAGSIRLLAKRSNFCDHEGATILEDIMLQDSFLYQEIHEQPGVLANLIDNELDHIQNIAAGLRRRRLTHTLIAARGTSDNAGRYAQYLFGAVNHMPVGLATPSLYSIYHRPPKLEDALVIGISQSGRSPISSQWWPTASSRRRHARHYELSRFAAGPGRR